MHNEAVIGTLFVNIVHLTSFEISSSAAQIKGHVNFSLPIPVALRSKA
jgi:hypothetical protein